MFARNKQDVIDSQIKNLKEKKKEIEREEKKQHEDAEKFRKDVIETEAAALKEMREFIEKSIRDCPGKLTDIYCPRCTSHPGIVKNVIVPHSEDDRTPYSSQVGFVNLLVPLKEQANKSLLCPICGAGFNKF